MEIMFCIRNAACRVQGCIPFFAPLPKAIHHGIHLKSCGSFLRCLCATDCVDKANVSGAATEVEAVETPQANNSQANRPETTRAGAVTNLRDLPGAHPYSLLQEGKREGKNSAQSTDARTKANDDHTDQYGDYYGFSAKAAESISIAGSASKAANCHYPITLQTFACTSNNPNTPNLRKSIDPGCIHSGRGDHKNNPDSVHVKDHGPI